MALWGWRRLLYRCLYASRFMGWPTPEVLKMGACSAAASLNEVGASDGVKIADEVLKLCNRYG